jgi:hypothetical protein
MGDFSLEDAVFAFDLKLTGRAKLLASVKSFAVIVEISLEILERLICSVSLWSNSGDRFSLWIAASTWSRVTLMFSFYLLCFPFRRCGRRWPDCVKRAQLCRNCRGLTSTLLYSHPEHLFSLPHAIPSGSERKNVNTSIFFRSCLRLDKQHLPHLASN